MSNLNFLCLHCGPIFFSPLVGILFSAFFNWRITLKNSMWIWQANSIWSTFSWLTEMNTFNWWPQWLSLTILFGELYLSSMNCPHTHHTSHFTNFFFSGPHSSRFNMIIKIWLRLVEEIISSWGSLLIDEKKKLHLEAPRHLHFQSTFFQLSN